MKVLVTGATGFVASHLIPALALADHNVIALGHDAARIPAVMGVEPLVGDLRDLSAVSLPTVDAVVHLAQANVPFPDGAADLHAVNTASTVVLLDHARRCGAQRFVFASSASVYGFGEGSRSEDERLTVTDFYSMTKLAAEGFVNAYQPYFGTSSLRLVAPYGPGQEKRMIPRLIESVREGRPITLNVGDKPRMNPIYIDDVVRVIAGAIATDGNHLLNVAGDDAATIREMADAIGAALGAEPQFVQGEGRAGELVCSNRRMRDLFQLDDLVRLDDGLARTAR